MENEEVALKTPTQEIILKARNGMPIFLLMLLGIVLSIIAFIWGFLF